MPIYPGRRKGTFRVTVWARGKQHEEIVLGSRSDALEHEARMRLKLRTPSPTQRRTAPGFSEFCATDYQRHARAHLGARTCVTRGYHIVNLSAFFGRTRLSDLTTAMVEQYTAERSRVCMASSVNNELRTLGAMLAYARDVCDYPVAEVKIRKLRESERRVRAWSADEVDRLLVTCRRKDPRLFPMLVFLLNTGCRKGEAIAAPWSWVDERRKMLCIAPTAAWAPKTKKPREVPISDALWSTLRGMPRSSPWIFPTMEGERFLKFPDMRFVLVRRAAKLLGGPHTCRHTFASHFLAAGRTMQELATILGHSIMRTTELYAHLLPGHLEATRNAVNFHPGATLAKQARSARNR